MKNDQKTIKELKQTKRILDTFKPYEQRTQASEFKQGLNKELIFLFDEYYRWYLN